MSNMHAHGIAIDRIGSNKVRTHYNLTRQGLLNWRKLGVPERYHNSLRLLAMVNGVQVPELDKEQA